MELLYIYIDNYKRIFENQQFNFSNEFRFEYITGRNELQIKKNSLFQPNFFCIKELNHIESGKVINVTGIIGKNGAGKTTILDFIKENIVESGINSTRSIIITRNEKNQLFIHRHHSLLIRNINSLDIKMKENIYSQNLSDISIQRTNFLPDTTVVSYSNIFDARNEYESNEIRNVSTNYLVKRYKKDAVERDVTSFGFSETELYRLEEIRKQLSFFYTIQNGSIDIPISFPKYITISARETNFKWKDIKRKYRSKNIQPILNLQETIRTTINEKMNDTKNYHEAVKIRFYKSLIDSFLHELLVFNNDHEIIKQLVTIEISDNEDEDLYFILKNLLSEISEALEGLWIQEWIYAIGRILDIFKEFITSKTAVFFNNSFVLEINSTEEESPVKELLDLQFKAVKFRPFLDFDWDGDLSSGEKALLGFYSRLFSLIDEKQIAYNMQISKNILILIDEGELYLHPEWQRKFIYNMIAFLQTTYRKRNIQIILTSNSPIIVSDIPTSNMILIDKSERERRVISELKANKQTFASNIHTLFSDAFFMSSGLIGEFASYKVSSLIDKINTSSSETIFEQRNEIEALISQIGEPILRTKITSMMREKLNSYNDTAPINIQLLKTIQDMQKQIDELKRGR